MDGQEIPFPKKPKIRRNSHKDVVQYHDRVFEVPPEMIYYFSDLPDVLEARIKRALENGMMHMYPDGSYGCHYCGYYAMNLQKMIAENPGKVIIHNTSGTPGISVSGCTYDGVMNVRWATRLTNKKSGVVVMAQKKPCVVYDSMLVEMIERGLLDEYESDRKFDFPTIPELEENPELQEKYRVR
jgi:hypothetical protein